MCVCVCVGGGGEGRTLRISGKLARIWLHIFVHYLCPAIFNGGGGEYSITFVHTFVRTNNGFRAISFETIGVLDSNFIHR